VNYKATLIKFKLT